MRHKPLPVFADAQNRDRPRDRRCGKRRACESVHRLPRATPGMFCAASPVFGGAPWCRSAGLRSWDGTNRAGAWKPHSLIFVQIFVGNIILGHFMRVNFVLISVPCVFDARHYFGLERVSFLDQLVDTLRVRAFDVGQSL